MTFDMVDRQFRRRETILGLAALSSCAPQPSTPPPRLSLGDTRIFGISGYGRLLAVAVGSRVTCSPAPTGTDQDWLAQGPSGYGQRVDRQREQLTAALDCSGWQSCSTVDNPEYPGEFGAWRNGEDNLIVAWDAYFYDRFMVASRVARDLNLLRKEDRVALFQAVLYGRYHTHKEHAT